MNLHVFFAGVYFGGIAALLGQMVATDTASGPLGVRGFGHFLLTFLSAVTWPISLIAAYIVTGSQRREHDRMVAEFDAQPKAMPAVPYVPKLPSPGDSDGLDLVDIRRACEAVAATGRDVRCMLEKMLLLEDRHAQMGTGSVDVDCDCDEACGDDRGCQEMCGCTRRAAVHGEKIEVASEQSE